MSRCNLSFTSFLRNTLKEVLFPPAFSRRLTGDWTAGQGQSGSSLSLTPKPLPSGGCTSCGPAWLAVPLRNFPLEKEKQWQTVLLGCE